MACFRQPSLRSMLSCALNQTSASRNDPGRTCCMLMNSRSKRRTVITLVLVASIIAVLLWVASYHPSEFRGGLEIHDSGLFSYPRYRAVLGRLPLFQSREYSFKVRGLPPGPLDFALQLDDFEEAERPLVASLSTSIAVSLNDDSGKTICSARGSLSDYAAKGNSEGIWVLRGGVTPLPTPLRTELWNTRCLNLPISRVRAYDMVVRVTDADPRTPTKIVLLPTLSGGGIELP